MIIPQPQLYRHDPENGFYGDCWRTCIAMLLGIPAEDVPHFAKDAILAGDEPGTGGQMVRDYLAIHGLGRAKIIFHAEERMDTVLESMKGNSPGIPYSLLGKSPRGDWGHVVVCLDGQVADPASGTWRDDPLEALDGAWGDFWHIEMIVKLPQKRVAMVGSPVGIEETGQDVP